MSTTNMPIVTKEDIANAEALERWAEMQKKAARAVGFACDAWADVTGTRCYAEIDGDTITIRTAKPSSANGTGRSSSRSSAATTE